LKLRLQQFLTAVVYFFTASPSSVRPRPGVVGISSIPSASRCQPPAVISSMKGER